MKLPLNPFPRARGQEEATARSSLRTSCLSCGEDLTTSPLYQRYRVCPKCRFHYSLTAGERIELLADEGSFKEAYAFLSSRDPLGFPGKEPYKKRLAQAKKATGLYEAAVVGVAAIRGNPVVLLVLDFGFLGGSMGTVVGEKVTLAFELATIRKLPLVSVVSSAGVRVQEGLLSLMQMAKTSAAVQRLSQARLPFISILANPATGAVYASFANLGDVIISEPGALLGLAPLRAVEEARGSPLPYHAHTSESHLAQGLIDQVAERPRLRDVLVSLLELFHPYYHLIASSKGSPPAVSGEPGEGTWQTITLARHKERPSASDYIPRVFSSFFELRGDRVYGDDRGVICGLGDLGGQAAVVVAQERDYIFGEGLKPEGLHKAQRAMALAAKFSLPLITFIDTQGVSQRLEDEERGLGNAIASTMATLSRLPVPVVSVIIGEGGSEAAMALGVADRILMMEKAIFSVISPEGAAALLFRDTSKVEDVASALKLTAQDAKKLGVVDGIIPEPEGGAHNNPEEAARQLKKALVQHLLEIQATPARWLLEIRYRKFRSIGVPPLSLGRRLAQALGGFSHWGWRLLVGKPSEREEPFPGGVGDFYKTGPDEPGLER